jgi:DNA-binding NarL/FixJ family response regulator
MVQVLNNSAAENTSAHKPITVALVEDNHNTRASLADLINSSPNYTCVAALADGETACSVLPELAPDAILMDIQLPQMSGIECIERLHELGVQSPVIVLSVYEDYETIFQSIVAGAVGYVLKNTPSVRLLEAIRDVHEGGSPMSSQIARKVIKAFQAMGAAAKETDNLTQREHEILRLVADGYTDKQIAEKLFISFETVRKHVKNMYKKLQVRSRSQATALYRRNFPAT